MFTRRLQAGVGGHACSNRGESHLDTRAKRAIDFGANLHANFGLARFINIRSQFLHSSLSSRQSMGSNLSSGLTSDFLTACTATSIRFASEWLPCEAEQCRDELFPVKTISICYDFLAVRNAFGSSIYISFLL